MKKIFKKVISSIMILSLLIYTLPMYVLAADESVFTKAKSNGESYKTIVTTKNDKETKQENTDKELPVETKITYILDGKEVTPEEVVGKSGKVTIKIDYINKSEKQVYVNGRYEKMYTPFVIAVGTLIDAKNNKNIEVKNAKLIENGEKTVVIGIVMPGMEESLKLSGEFASINIPSSIEITMDTTKFEMKNIISIATANLFNEELDLSKIDSLLSNANELKTAIDQIEEGANSLRDGVITLDDGTKTLNAGANQLNAGAYKLSDGANKLNDGAEALNDGAQSLSDGLNQLNSKTGELQTKLGELGLGVKKINTGAQTIKTNVNGLASKIPEYVSEEKIAQLEGLIQSNTNVLATLEEGTDLYNLIAGNIQALTQEKELLTKASKVNELVTGINDLADGINELKGETDKIPESITPLINGVKKLANGAEQLQGGAEQLYDGTTSLVNGANDLSLGMNSLADGTVSLTDGTSKLKDGSNQLAEGIHNYNEKGITKITNFLNGDLSSLINRVKKLEDLSKEYNKFNSDEVRDSIKFITIVDSIKISQKDKDNENIIIPEEDNNNKKEE